MKQLLRYLMVSGAVSIVDALISLVLFERFHMHHLIATNTGIIVGFILQYFLSLKWVFECDHSVRTVRIFLLTWLLGVGIANITVYILLEQMHVMYALGKLGSMGTSFFVLFGIRRRFLER